MAKARTKLGSARTIGLEAQPKKITWSESYTSLLLGMGVVIVIGVIIFSFAKNKGEPQQTSSVRNEAAKQEKTDKQISSELPKTYTVAAGDDLWSISEKLYKSGYNWVDIAKANNLADPDVLHVGVKLKIPDVKPKLLTIAQQKVSEAPKTNAITGDSYTVVPNDHLWSISVRAYGDGYKWVEIARANKLENPDLIFAGNKLMIPRK